MLDQSPDDGKLMIEAMTFDEEKGLYNFYELIGQGQGAQWFYRGDSGDALLDNQYLHRTPPPGEKKFGERMRCSACHNSGGPIMKELLPPHNDWWLADRQLIFAPNLLSDQVDQRVKKLRDASDFSNRVLMGSSIIAPTFSFSTSDYRELLDHFRIRFPENNEKDADHMWLTPIVSLVDQRAIKSLIAENIISEKMALDILMIDFKNPLFSKARCGLLRFVPQVAPEWTSAFLENLSRSTIPEALELRKYIDEEDSFLIFHEPALSSYVDSLQNRQGIEFLFRRLMNIRQQAFVDEISTNSRGQILEPGFRVIFPKVRR